MAYAYGEETNYAAPSLITPNSASELATSLSYNPAIQPTSVTVSEPYDWLAAEKDLEYRSPDSADDGRIASMKDWMTGQELAYQYDSLKRLTAATATTGTTTNWRLEFGYDGFGNLLSQDATIGSAPELFVAVNPQTDRIASAGHSYDANGNLTATPFLSLTYDVANRPVSVTHTTNGTTQYVYGPNNRVVWKSGPSGGGYSLYAPDGSWMGNYYYWVGYGGHFTLVDWGLSFAGRKIWVQGGLQARRGLRIGWGPSGWRGGGRATIRTRTAKGRRCSRRILPVRRGTRRTTRMRIRGCTTRGIVGIPASMRGSRRRTRTGRARGWGSRRVGIGIRMWGMIQ